MGSHNMLREVGVGESGFVAAGGVVPVEAKGPKQTNKETKKPKKKKKNRRTMLKSHTH